MAFTNFARALRDLSTCKRLRVGCVIFPLDMIQVYAVGYNGPSTGESHDACTQEEGNCGCIHAEANAIIKLRTDDQDCVLFTTHSPCPHCAGLIVNKRQIKYVLFDTVFRDPRGLSRLHVAGITTYYMKDLMKCFSSSQESDSSKT